VPAQLARNQDAATSRFRFRDAIPGVRGYERLAGPIAWLEKAGLLVRASLVESPSVPLSSHASENMFKLYMADCGLLGALAEIPPEVMLQYGYGTYQGYMAENFVAQELRAAGCHDLYFWQGRTSEIEFLLTSGRFAVPIEVKSGSVTRSRSLAVFEQKYAPHVSVVLSARNQRSSVPRYHVPVYAAGFVPELICQV